jgi:hypothetical protein
MIVENPILRKSEIDTQYVSFKTEHGGKRIREESKSVVGRLERMKHDSGIKDRDDKSNGTEIFMTDDFTKINPTDPLKWVKQTSSSKEEKLILQ